MIQRQTVSEGIYRERQLVRGDRRQWVRGNTETVGEGRYKDRQWVRDTKTDSR